MAFGRLSGPVYQGRAKLFSWFNDAENAARAYDRAAREPGLPREKLDRPNEG
jgi:hypothetical protein